MKQSDLDNNIEKILIIRNEKVKRKIY